MFTLGKIISTNIKAFSAMGIFSVLPILSSSIAVTLLLKHQSFIASFSTMEWAIAFSLASITMAFALTPTTLIAISAGYFLGWNSIPSVIVAYLTASAIGFFLGKTLDKGHLLQSLQRYPKVLSLSQHLSDKAGILVMLFRLSPILPFCLTNLLMATLNIRFGLFMAVGLLGMLPRTIFSIWLGIQSQALIQLFTTPTEQPDVVLLTVTLVILSGGGLVILLQKGVKQILNPKHP